MAYHDDLLRQAIQLAHKEPRNPRQASLRRAVSTAYYALFHLLISEAVGNWNRVNLRAALGRAFDHRTMKAASNRLQDTREFPFTGEDPRTVAALRGVAKTFVQLQEKRRTADYDNTTFWTRTEALAQVKSAEQAFNTWDPIRNEQIAQGYLAFPRTRTYKPLVSQVDSQPDSTNRKSSLPADESRSICSSQRRCSRARSHSTMRLYSSGGKPLIAASISSTRSMPGVYHHMRFTRWVHTGAAGG